MTKQQVVDELRRLVEEEGMELLKTKYNPNGSSGGVLTMGFDVTVTNSIYISWHTNVVSFLSKVLPQDNHYLAKICGMPKNTFSNATACIELIKNLIEQIERDIVSLKDENSKVDGLSHLNTIFTRFHYVARQLRSRHADRKTLDILDEYDVQDLIHALLKLYFDDIRPEEWTPSYAGGCSRMDFLLKNEKVVIEVKKTRSNMKDKNLGEQLIIDIEKYKAHPDCEKLICFVYDPEGLVGNPMGIASDLVSTHGGFVDVIIKP